MTASHEEKTKPLHWYRGAQDKGLAVCGKGTNRVDWTDVEEKWKAATRRCHTCETKK